MDALHNIEGETYCLAGWIKTRFSRILSVILSLGVMSCTCIVACDVPRPTINVFPLGDHNPPRVHADIIPNQFEVTDVVLTFERQGISYDSTPSSYDLPRGVTPSLPSAQPFTASFTLAGKNAPPFGAGEVIDFRFRATHLTAENSLLFSWSEPHSFKFLSSDTSADLMLWTDLHRSDPPGVDFAVFTTRITVFNYGPYASPRTRLTIDWTREFEAPCASGKRFNTTTFLCEDLPAGQLPACFDGANVPFIPPGEWATIDCVAISRDLRSFGTNIVYEPPLTASERAHWAIITLDPDSVVNDPDRRDNKTRTGRHDFIPYTPFPPIKGENPLND